MKRRKHQRSISNIAGRSPARFSATPALAFDTPITVSGVRYTPERRGSSALLWIRGAAIVAGVLAFGASVGAGIHAATCATERGARSIQCNPDRWGSVPYTNPAGGARDTNKPAQPPTYPAASKSGRAADYRYMQSQRERAR